MIHRLRWLLRRTALRKKGIEGRLSSFVDARSDLEGFNYLAQRSKVLNSRMGLFSYVNYDAVVSQTDIGRYSCVGPHALVGGTGGHPIDRRSTHRMFYSNAVSSWTGFSSGGSEFTESARTHVGHDVWIGLRAVVMDGVSIGSGAIVAAGAVVTKDVEPYAIVGGVPARLIRKRFQEETIRSLLNEKWWEKPIEEVLEMAKNGKFSKSLKFSDTEHVNSPFGVDK